MLTRFLILQVVPNTGRSSRNISMSPFSVLYEGSWIASFEVTFSRVVIAVERLFFRAVRYLKKMTR